MTRSKELLYNRYIKPIKTNPKAYIGVEFEFPIVNTLGAATDIAVSKALLAYLVEECSFQSVQKDADGTHVQVKEPVSGDAILFEVSYNILEFAFEKALTIQEIDQRFKRYLELIQSYLRKHHHELQGWGVHPHWKINDNRPVALPRYQMLLYHKKSRRVLFTIIQITALLFVAIKCNLTFQRKTSSQCLTASTS